MKISSWNEWDTLREIVVGDASLANWPSNDPVFAMEGEKTLWKETPVPSGAVPQFVISEANEDLESLVDILKQAGVIVHRPEPMDFVALGGMYNYCPRDRLLIAGDVIVDPPMMYPCRDMEIESLQHVIEGNTIIRMPRDQDMILDAANICKANDRWMFLDSPSGNRASYDWLVKQFPDITIELVNFYAGVHIDSTISLLREGLALVNAGRVTPDNLPETLKGWDIIWVDNVVERGFYQYPYASKWIGMNVLSIDPQTVIVDKLQTELITILEKKKFTVITHELRHSRTLGGGYHCVTLDTWRHHD